MTTFFADVDVRGVLVPSAELRWLSGDARVEIVSGTGSGLGGLGAQTEIWKYLLWVLVGLLLCEQVLGWVFGMRR